jgi:LysM repeat protein
MANKTYTVKSGDSLSKIAKELLGDANRWREIYKANEDKIKNPDLIYPGQELVIPGAAPDAPVTPAALPPTAQHDDDKDVRQRRSEIA